MWPTDPVVASAVLNGCFWSKMVISSRLAAVEYLKPFKLSIKCLWCSFLGYLEYILATARIKFKFSMLAFFIGYRPIGGVRWRRGLKTHFKIFLKGISVQEGQVEHVLTMANLKLKPSLFMPRPTHDSLVLPPTRLTGSPFDPLKRVL